MTRGPTVQREDAAFRAVRGAAAARDADEARGADARAPVAPALGAAVARALRAASDVRDVAHAIFRAADVRPVCDPAATAA